MEARKRLSIYDLKKDTSWEKAVIVFTENSFKKEYSELERSYEVNKDCKYFDSSKIGNSLFGNCLDGKDKGVRLDWYMHPSESDRWKVEYCYIIE